MTDMRGGATDGEYDDDDYYSALKANGAAGVFFACRATNRILLGHRSQWVEMPRHWSGFGGAIDSGETAEQCVRREIAEETGYRGSYELIPVYRFSSPTFSYQNYVAFTDEEFEPRLQWENTDARWFALGDLPAPLHPGIVACLEDTLTKKVLRQNLNLREDVSMLSHNPHDVDPTLLTFSEYYKLVNPYRENHPNSAYDESLSRMNEYFDIGQYPKIIRQIRVNNIPFTVRIKATKSQYVKQNAGQRAEYFTDDEIRQLGWKLYEYTIVVVDDQGRKVASLQDEWGCVLVMVAREYRGFGFGKMLARLSYEIEPTKTSGGFTESGYRTFRKIYRDFVKQALSSGRYSGLIRQGKLTLERVKEIVGSTDLKTDPKPAPKDLNSRDPRNWLLYGDDVTFILYDRKLREQIDDDHWGDEMIKGMIHIGSIEGFDDIRYSIVYRIGAENKTIKNFLMRCAAAACERAGEVLLLDPDDAADVNPAFLTVGRTHRLTGYTRTEVRLAERFDPSGMCRQERDWRKIFDHYDEFYHRLVERADSKYQNS